MSKDEYLITDKPLKALTIFAMPMIRLSSVSLSVLLHWQQSVPVRHLRMFSYVWHLVPV